MTKNMKDFVSKASLALAFGVGAIGTMGVVAPTEASATTAPAAPAASSTNKMPDVKVTTDGGVQTFGEMARTDGETGMANAWTDLIKKYRFWISGIAGIAAVSMILFFILNFMKLGASAGNPSARSQAITGLVFTGIAAAGLGGVAIIVGFFYTALA
ncbi:hypothetical protein JMA_42360 (plasmid) [Jeotgalibacillus malaysiensis]|uniref:Uncharacterized protein n=1 Tax=Jeotgalibacillus malaysiensis TaxID=1508404 RepID=A0A0B5AYG6_9BACL|nr:hypothetical protein [Jeotgalibacillus malaysiensis]AJD93553.1 hypothetical protein JMA_42360 [Jeotgalibacillus malaysiensis]